MNNKAPSKQILNLIYLEHPELQDLNLEPQQLIFCIEYTIDFNGTHAAIRAEYSKKNACHQAIALLARPQIIKALQILTHKKLETIQQTADIAVDDVIKGIKEVIERCMQGKPVMIREGGKLVESGEWKFDSAGALRGFELLGKHLAMWVERKIVTHELTWEQRIRLLRGENPQIPEKATPVHIDVEPEVVTIELKR